MVLNEMVQISTFQTNNILLYDISSLRNQCLNVQKFGLRGPHPNLGEIPKNNDLFSMGPPNRNKRDCSIFDLFIAHIYVPDICDNVQECMFNFDKLLRYIFIFT